MRFCHLFTAKFPLPLSQHSGSEMGGVSAFTCKGLLHLGVVTGAAAPGSGKCMCHQGGLWKQSPRAHSSAKTEQFRSLSENLTLL